IGVVGDVKHAGLGAEAGSEVYVPYLQMTFSRMCFVMRTEGDPLALAGTVRSQALSIDSNQPVFQLKTMNRYLFDSVAGARFNTILVNVFAGLAMSMAIVGIYGILSYAVSQRTHEIGIRMALGASRVQVLRLIV